MILLCCHCADHLILSMIKAGIMLLPTSGCYEAPGLSFSMVRRGSRMKEEAVHLKTDLPPFMAPLSRGEYFQVTTLRASSTIPRRS